jgi:HD superfamily phosphohydrolase
MREQPEIIDYLLDQHHAAIRDPLWGHMYISPDLLSLVDTPEGQKLGRIRQLGPTAMVYPGATHNRLSHSFGVFHIARSILIRLVHQPDCPALSGEGVRAFLAAALLHDLGHFPYTHSFKTLPLEEHEVLTGKIVENGEIARRLKERVQVDPAMVAAIVDQRRPSHGVDELRLFRNLLSGTMDPDKLDYLNRDAYFCGVPYGVQDLDYALSQIVPNGYHGVALHENGITVVENILFSKYLMYRTVYWHRTVRAATGMIRKAIFLGLRDAVIRPQDLYGLTDDQFFASMSSIDWEPFSLIHRVSQRELLKPAGVIPFNAALAAHRKLEDQEVRLQLEQQISEQLGVPEWEIVIDLPDSISFEADIPIRHGEETQHFAERSVFSANVVSQFTTQLRMIRLFAPSSIVQKEGINILSEVLPL